MDRIDFSPGHCLPNSLLEFIDYTFRYLRLETMKLLFFLMILLSNHAYASVWQDQATAFREYADQLANNKYPDYRKAYHFYCVSTAMNEKQAAYEIANLYLHGHGVEASLPIAKGWLVYSAKLGHQQAVDKLKEYPEIISTNDPFCPKHDASKKMNKKDIQAWVTLISPTFGLDPQMVNAVITVESGFNPKAISKKNARGLMQLLPSTAKRLGVKNSFDPVQNMIGGITYLRYLLQMFSGD
ncbi:MAG TPA: hypothetical protein ENJ32_11975, partial [Crenotrichaceae bacterium]|nr:hypothetical protein [Crenotrichaceae bacterium]